MNAPEPYRALYLHMPFCVSRCGYCDFYTEAVPCDDPRLGAYVDALAADVARTAELGRLSSVETVYLGGGTPSFFGPILLDKLLGVLDRAVDVSSLTEFTVEGNPDSLSRQVLDVLVGHGVNRISIGVQSLDDEVLSRLGRVHDAGQALQAIERACASIDNVSVDVICGVPGQSLDSLLVTVLQLVDAGVSHVSVYPLMIERGTPLEEAVECGDFEDVDDDVQAEHMECVADVLAEAGFVRYEVASYARPGFESRHNMMYWTGASYLGLGDGAASMLNLSDGSRLRIKRIGEEVGREELDARQAACEDAMLGMRLVEGIELSRLEALVEHAPALESAIDEVVSLGLAKKTSHALIPTSRGWLMGNELYGRIWAAAE